LQKRPNCKKYNAEINKIILLLFKNRRRDIISLNQPQDMSAKMAVNGIRTHARTNQRRTLASRSRQSLNAGRLYYYCYQYYCWWYCSSKNHL